MIRRDTTAAAEAFDAAWTAHAGSRRTDATGVRSGDSEVAELLAIAEQLRTTEVPHPSDDFRATLRDRLVTEAAEVLVASPPRPVAAVRPRRRRLVTVAAAALVTSVSVGGLSVSSASAVPGDVLYPVKRGIEDVQASMHRDAADRGRYELERAAERLDEASWLRSHDGDEHLAATLAAFGDLADRGSERVLDAHAADSSTDLKPVDEFVAASSIQLAEIAADAPADTRPALRDAAEQVTDLATRLSQACTTCLPADIGSLVDTVQSSAAPAPKVASKQAEPASSTSDTAPSQPRRSTGGAPAAAAPAPSAAAPRTPAPTKPSASAPTKPSTPSTPKAPSLRGVGGLVPELVGGLLGTTK